MKTIIAGGRDIQPRIHYIAWLDAHVPKGTTEIVSGGAKGADTLGEWWAEKEKLDVTRFPADWKTHGRAAGPIRNKQMAEYADYLVVFPGGGGTANMIKEAEKRGLPIIRFEEGWL